MSLGTDGYIPRGGISLGALTVSFGYGYPAIPILPIPPVVTPSKVGGPGPKGVARLGATPGISAAKRNMALPTPAPGTPGGSASLSRKPMITSGAKKKKK